LERYQDFVWARDVVLDRIAICEMGAKKVVENGEVVGEQYTEVASVSLLVDRG
jgi:activating signal cointegrator complex subunit 1